MSGRRVKRLGETNSALLHQINAGSYSKAAIDALLGIGVANKRWINLAREGASTPTSQKQNITYGNVGGTDGNWTFQIPLPYIIGGTHNLIITQVKVGIADADEGDELDRVRLFGYTDEDSSVQFLDTGVGLNENAAAEYIWDHADTTIGGVYEKVWYLLGVIISTTDDLDFSYVQAEYYYT